MPGQAFPPQSAQGDSGQSYPPQSGWPAPSPSVLPTPSGAAPPPYELPAPAAPVRQDDDEWWFDQDDRSGPAQSPPVPSSSAQPGPAQLPEPTSSERTLPHSRTLLPEPDAGRTSADPLSPNWTGISAGARFAAANPCGAGLFGLDSTATPLASAAERAAAGAAQRARPETAAGPEPRREPAQPEMPGQPEQPAKQEAHAKQEAPASALPGQPEQAEQPGQPGASQERATRSWAFDRPADPSSATNVIQRPLDLPKRIPRSRSGAEPAPAAGTNAAAPAGAGYRSVWEPLVRKDGGQAGPAPAGQPDGQASTQRDRQATGAGSWQTSLSRQPDTIRRTDGRGQPPAADPAEPAAIPSDRPTQPRYVPATGISRQPAPGAQPAVPSQQPSGSPPPSGAQPLPRRQPQTHLAAPLRRQRPTQVVRPQPESRPPPSVWDAASPAAAAEQSPAAEGPGPRDNATG